MDLKKIKKISYGLRKKIFQSIYDGNGGHIGGSFSVIDLLTYLYAEILKIDPTNPEHPDRDRLIFSKGHSCQALYWALAEFNFFEEEIIMDYGSDGALFAGHPEFEKAPGIEISSGSLGHGPAIGVGMAYAAKLKNKNFDVYVIVGDGESNEGSVWEAAMSAPKFELNNLSVIIDKNNFQQTGSNLEIMDLKNLNDKWKSFGWDVEEVDGHDIKEIKKYFDKKAENDKPKLLIANTIKGKGFSFTENNNNWHHAIITEKLFNEAMKEIK